jgi:hypothetical protein
MTVYPFYVKNLLQKYENYCFNTNCHAFLHKKPDKITGSGLMQACSDKKDLILSSAKHFFIFAAKTKSKRNARGI